MNFGKFYLILH